ncbi:MAG: peptide ABC transporter ATP-binding protein [Deltaproteobacteria bacterium]|nr:MAG: peptide ABC transporter ATP-binding protein [Deltaproteobacteria bacterium]
MLAVNNLSVSFSSYSFGLRRQTVQAVTDLSIEIEAGKILAVVGQSGGGKSLLVHALLDILPKNAKVSGDIYFKGELLTKRRLQGLRGRKIALIPQSMMYLDPLLQVGRQLTRAARLNGYNKGSARQMMLDALRQYHLPEEAARCYPFQLSGGMARRILVATATIGKADLLLADEPTNGLDGEMAAEAMQHLRHLADAGRAVLLISHDIEAALKVADDVVIIRNGHTIEIASASAFHRPDGLQHPYTRSLWQSLPVNDFLAVNAKSSADNMLKENYA